MSEDLTVESSGLSNSHIFRFYLPLALSWLFMAIESPIAMSVISRMANADISIAAFQPLMAVSLWIESPVIDLLTTATTLGKDRQHYVELSRFVWKIMAVVTVVHALVAATPLYWLLTEHVIGLDPRVSEVARPGLIVMIPWSALIGWRRYLQGLMIRNGQTRLIGMGTAVRMTTMALVAGGLYFLGSLSSIMVVSIGLVCAVAAEAGFAHWASRPTVASSLAFDEPGLRPLSQRFLAHFHLPLSLTTMVTLLGQPMVSTALARSPHSILALGAFQVASTLIWLHRTIVFALPEVVITLYRDAASSLKLKRFCLYIGLGTTSVMALTSLSRLDVFFFHTLLGVSDVQIIKTAHLAMLLSCFLPLIGAMQSYLRGMLAAHHLTVSRLAAMGVSVTCLILLLFVGVGMRWPGIVTSCVALTVSQLAELGVLGYSWRRGTVALAV
ncbi:MAG: hypothetical protein BGO01_03100 [Armatimonadetes bacterium 55-13]|nr:hypothetical protein [Armatimonadota bacterium]OJU63647.1 MAG: hypothetical protein BGO01_03100 [Armatimonadetes bacterium 55-13]